MVSKICEIFEMIDQAEELNSFISKWKKVDLNRFLDTSSKEQQLQNLIVKPTQCEIESTLQEIESNLPFWQEKIRKKLKFNSWRKSQRNRSKTTKYSIRRKLFRICKLDWKQRIDSEYESLQKFSSSLAPIPSKSVTKHIQALLNILKSQDPSKHSYYLSQLSTLTDSPLPATHSPPHSPIYPFDAFLKDYLSLVSSPTYTQSREDSWSQYTQNS